MDLPELPSLSGTASWPASGWIYLEDRLDEADFVNVPFGLACPPDPAEPGGSWTASQWLVSWADALGRRVYARIRGRCWVSQNPQNPLNLPNMRSAPAALGGRPHRVKLSHSFIRCGGGVL